MQMSLVTQEKLSEKTMASPGFGTVLTALDKKMSSMGVHPHNKGYNTWLDTSQLSSGAAPSQFEYQTLPPGRVVLMDQLAQEKGGDKGSS